MVLNNRSWKLLLVTVLCFVCLQYLLMHNLNLGNSEVFGSFSHWISGRVDQSLLMVCKKHGIPSTLLSDSLPAIEQFRILSVPIPQIIHQSWKNRNVPDDFKKWSKSWREQNIGWKFKLWDDDENRRLTAERFPWFLETYDSFKFEIMRADVARYMYMHQYGGVYADLDTWCLRSMNNITRLFGDSGIVLAMISGDNDFQHDIPNAWMMSSPNHPFWIFLLRVIQTEWTKFQSQGNVSEEVEVESITGPVVLKKALKVWSCLAGRKAPITVIPPGYIYLQDWRNEEAYQDAAAHCDPHELQTEECLSAYPNGHVLTFWSHSWG